MTIFHGAVLRIGVSEFDKKPQSSLVEGLKISGLGFLLMSFSVYSLPCLVSTQAQNQHALVSYHGATGESLRARHFYY